MRSLNAGLEEDTPVNQQLKARLFDSRTAVQTAGLEELIGSITKFRQFEHHLDVKEVREVVNRIFAELMDVLKPPKQSNAERHLKSFPSDQLVELGRVMLSLFEKSAPGSIRDLWNRHIWGEDVHNFYLKLMGLPGEPMPSPGWTPLRHNALGVFAFIQQSGPKKVREKLDEDFLKLAGNISTRTFARGVVTHESLAEQLSRVGITVNPPAPFKQFKDQVVRISKKLPVEMGVLRLRVGEDDLIWVHIADLDATVFLLPEFALASGHVHPTQLAGPQRSSGLRGERIHLSRPDRKIADELIRRSPPVPSFVVEWVRGSGQLHVAVLDRPGKRWKYYKGDKQAAKALEHLGIIEPPSTGLEEDEVLMQRALSTPTDADALKRGEVVTLEGGVRVVQVPAQLQAWSARIYLQVGLEEPKGLPAETHIVRFGAGLEETLQMWRRSPPRSTDVVVFNVEQTPEGLILTAALPLAHPMPAILRARPEVAIAYFKLEAAAWLARRFGIVVDLETMSVNFLQVGPTTYAILRAA